METALATKHRCLIDNLTKLFNLFVTLRYIAATDVIYPPHIDPPINTADMARLGFDPEVITLVTLLPQLRHEVVWGWQEEGTALLPRSMAVNYLSPALDVLFDRLRDGSSNDLLPPTVLRLTRGGNVGHSLLYDTADRWLYSLPTGCTSTANLAGLLQRVSRFGAGTRSGIGTRHPAGHAASPWRRSSAK